MIRETHFPALLSRTDAARRSFVERMEGGTVVFTNGVFDILHRGHLDYLKAARELGTTLIVGLNSDESVRRIKGQHRPIVHEDDRAFALISLRFVDHVVIFEEDTPEKVIEEINPSILVKGGDYRPEDVVGSQHVLQHGGQVIIIPFRDGYSTTQFIQKITERYR
jgi:D-beta-D-heptose 7-phosphate kinase / D-beta-D-heptose 1-phosphate adenosyltransferase